MSGMFITTNISDFGAIFLCKLPSGGVGFLKCVFHFTNEKEELRNANKKRAEK